MPMVWYHLPFQTLSEHLFIKLQFSFMETLFSFCVDIFVNCQYFKEAKAKIKLSNSQVAQLCLKFKGRNLMKSTCKSALANSQIIRTLRSQRNSTPSKEIKSSIEELLNGGRKFINQYTKKTFLILASSIY